MLYMVQIDAEDPETFQANLLTEVLDQFEPKHTRSVLKVWRVLRFDRGRTPELGQKRVFFWDEFDAEWQSYQEGD